MIAERGKTRTGTVKWYRSDKGYGFIAGDDGQDVFVHISAVAAAGLGDLEKRERVSFSMNEVTGDRRAVRLAPA